MRPRPGRGETAFQAASFNAPVPVPCRAVGETNCCGVLIQQYLIKAAMRVFFLKKNVHDNVTISCLCIPENVPNTMPYVSLSSGHILDDRVPSTGTEYYRTLLDIVTCVSFGSTE
jgi:hypothetical protein